MQKAPLQFLMLRWKKLSTLLELSKATLSEDLIDAVDKYVKNMIETHEGKTFTKSEFGKSFGFFVRK